MSIQFKGFAGSRGGTYFNLEIGYALIFLFFDRKYFALKHVSLMHICIKTKTKAGLFQQYILCLVL